MRLDENHIYGAVFYSKLEVLGVKKKGKYIITGSYHSFVPSSMSFGLPILSREMGAFSANPVEISVDE
jgi:hypothetical protein